MKKLITGILIMFLAPFTIIVGSWMINQFYISADTKMFACVVGGISIVFNVIVGAALVIRGHQDNGTFKGW